MKSKQNLLLALIVIINAFSFNILAQDLSKLPENERNQKLITVAKDVYKAPVLKNFYREYKTPTITKTKTEEVPASEYNRIFNSPNSVWYGGGSGQNYYIVYFPYDLNKERFEEGYAAKVYIWESTGKAFAIGLGNKIMFPVRNGKVPDHDQSAPSEEYYTITYSKDIPNAASLPKTGKYGDIITIELKTVKVEAYDGWTTEQGYNFDPNTDLTNGQIISDLVKYGTLKTITYRVIQIMVTGNMKVNATRYQEEYDAPF